MLCTYTHICEFTYVVGTYLAPAAQWSRDDDIGPLSAMSTIGSWRQKGLTILLSAILLLLAVFVVVVLFNNMDSDSNTETEAEQQVRDRNWQTFIVFQSDYFVCAD